VDANFLRQIGSMGEPHMASADVDIDKLTPLADMVLVRRLPDEEKTASGLFLPATGRDKREGLRVGVVLRVGRGDYRVTHYPGGEFWRERVPMDVQIGDRVVYARCPDNDVRILGEDLVLLREEQHILAVLE
jgi:chaperonin GroES